MLEDGPADRAGPATAPAEGLHRPLEVVFGSGLALNLTVTAGAIAVGSAAWGAVANALGISGAFSWGSLAVALTLLAGIRWRFSSIATYDLSPAPLAEPDTPLAVPADGGPVFVTVSYQVQPGSEDEFQRAVQPLGWSRRRTGAVRWAILQRAESPGRFVEMFVVPSWDEYLRQQGRRTVSDAALDDRLRAFLEQGPSRTWRICLRHRSRTAMFLARE